jgi:hypothetical protein
MKKLLLAAAALAASSAAHAATVDYDSYGWYGVAIQIDTPANIYGGAGQIQLYNNGSLVADAWCMDIANYLTGSGLDGIAPFTQATVAGGLSGVPTDLSQVQLNTIANLVVNGNVAVQGGASASDSAAYQVAIWSVEYGSNFTYQSLGGAFANQVSSFIETADVGSGPSGYSLSFFDPIDPVVSQTLVVATPIVSTAAVPEASTWAMMLAGFGGLGVMAFRRARKSQISAFA